MSTYSTIGIVNKALVLCGATTISAIADDTPNARAVNAVWETARKSILTEAMWTFSTTRSTLVTVATTTIAWFYDEEAYVYTRPSGALKIWQLSDLYVTWREEGGYIIADTAGLGARWTFDQDDPSMFQPSFVEALIDKLCVDISYMILNSTQKAEAFLAKYEKVSLPKAKSDNSQIGSYSTVVDDAWTSAKSFNGTRANPSKSFS